jgi:hypothetical protein
MSLNWNAKTVKDWEDMTPEQQDASVWYTMFLDIGEITEENYEEFADRARIYDTLHGHKAEFSFLGDPKFVKRLIGLKTNVSTKTIRQWFGKQYKNLERNRIERAANKRLRAIPDQHDTSK